jgi:hypothetical protein
MPLLQQNQVNQNSSGSAIREDLADYIAIVDAKSTPFVSQAPKSKDLGNMRFDWQVDSYSAPVLAGVMDGTDVTVSSASNPVANRARQANYAQAFRRDLRIGFIAETQNVAGVSDELANGISKKLIEIKRDMEATFCCTNQTAQIESGSVGSGNAYLTSSLGNWMTGTPASGTVGLPATYSGGDYGPASGAVTTTTTANLTESTVQNVLTAIYGATGTYRTYDAIVGTTLKRAFTNLTAGAVTSTANSSNIAATSVRTFNQDLSADTFKSSIDIFTGDFGTLVLHPSVWIGSKTTGSTALTSLAYKGYVIPFDMVEVRYAKLPEVKDLPDAGGGPARLVQMIAGLVVKNAQGMGMFNGAS